MNNFCSKIKESTKEFILDTIKKDNSIKKYEMVYNDCKDCLLWDIIKELLDEKNKAV